MKANAALRILVAVAVQASSLPAFAGVVNLPGAATHGTPVGGPAVVAPMAPASVPNLSMPGGLSAASIVLPLAAPSVLQPAAVTPAARAMAALPGAAVPMANPSRTAAPAAAAAVLPEAAPAQNAAGQTVPAAFAAAAARSNAVTETVGRLFAAPAARGSAQMGTKLGSFFDSSRVAGQDVNGVTAKAEADDTPEVTAAEGADFAPNGAAETLDLWVGKAARSKLYDSQVSASIRLINNKGSAWFWGKYQKELPVRVVSGGRMLFVTRIVEAETKKVKDLDLRDLKAYYGARIARAENGMSEAALTAKLRQRLLAEVRGKAARNPNSPKVISLDSEVRVLHYLSYRQAQHLAENNAEPTPAVRPRNPVNVPAKLEPLSRMLPRVVMVDLRGAGDKIPFDLLEDMGKLEKSGVTFVMLTDKPQEEVERMIERGVTLAQRDDVVRWKLLSLSNDGNTLYGYSGSFAKLLASRRFEPYQQAIIRTAAEAAAPEGVIIEDKAFGLSMRPKRGVSPTDLSAALARQLARFGLPADAYSMTTVEVDGQPAVRVRPGTLANSTDWLLKQLQVEQGIYLNQENILTVTDDAAIRAALPKSIHAAQEMPGVAPAERVETALAALLGPYRENRQGDLVASASSIKSFKAKRFYESGGGSDMRIYMLLGHVAHTAFDWAMMVYNDTGKMPPVEALLAKAHEIWEKENIEATVHLMEKSRERSLGYRDSMDARMQTMYLELEQAVKLYPLSLGTELPNLMVVERFNKAGEPTHRDIFRGLYDLVLARRVEGGLDVMIGDFKTGQTPALQHMLKDVQVLLYDFFSRVMWETLAVPYTVLGPLENVVRRSLGFIYPRGMQGVSISEFDRLPFENLLANVMNGMRKRKGVKTFETMAKEKAKAEKEAKAIERAAKKAAKEAAGGTKPKRRAAPKGTPNSKA